MALTDALLPECDREFAVTRTLLERVPDDRADWRPHPKSMSLGELAVHLGQIPVWLSVTLDLPELDTNPPGGTPFPRPSFTGRTALLAHFDEALAQARASLARTTDAQFAEPWSLKDGGRVMLSMPRAAVVRTFVLSHMVHHRGQLSVYLRLLDVPLPSIYGPTADLK